jgi:2-oxoglutarate ferredoxin oxidoreductase subunit beta
VDEFGLINKMTGVAPVGCSVFAYKFFNFDMAQAAHGRAPAVATGMKRARPDMHVFTYQGDGDLAAIGTAEIIHAANRGEHISVFFVNNAIYGMTGGQMAPTTLPEMKPTTSPYGRKTDDIGFPDPGLRTALFPGGALLYRESVAALTGRHHQSQKSREQGHPI